MKGVSFGQYYPADSVIHRMDPRAKIILATICIVCSFICSNALGFAVLAVWALALILLSRIPLRVILRSLRAILMIIVFTSVINIFMTTGEQLLTPEGWVIKIYAEGLWNALFMVLRIVCLILSTGIFLTYTTTPVSLANALERLLSPLKKIKIPATGVLLS